MTSDELRDMSLTDQHNEPNEYQGCMRYGWPDLALLQYALKCNPCDSLAVNCVDQVAGKMLHVRGRIDNERRLWHSNVIRQTA